MGRLPPTPRLTGDAAARRARTDARSAVLYTKSRTIIQPDYSWRVTDLWITFPWSAQKPVNGVTAVNDA